MRHADDGTLNAWLDGALPPDEAAAVAVHLEHCDACRTRLTEVTSWRVGAASLLASAAPGDVNIPPFERVLERAAAHPPAGSQPIVHYRPGALLQPLPAWSTLAWAATIVLALLIGWYGRELVLRQGPARTESGSLAVRTGAPAAATPAAPAAAPAANGYQLEAPRVVPPELPPPANGRVATRPEAQYAGQGAPVGLVAGAGAQARDSSGRAEVAAAPAAAPAPTGDMAERARRIEVAGLGAERGRAVAPHEAGKLAPAESVPAIAVRAAAPRPVAVAAPESLLAGRPADATRREAITANDQARAASEVAAAKALNVAAQGVAAAPTFTPYTVAPQLSNRQDVERAVEAFYPGIEKAGGIGGTTTVWLFLDDQGHVLNTLVKQSSGHMALDSAALRVALLMRFTPALNRDQPVRVWVAVPVVFKPAIP